MTETILKVENLSKSFSVKHGGLMERKQFKAVDDVSFSLAKGETLGIVGESGCGKTTLARIIVGFETPDSGKVLLNGNVIAEQHHRRKINTSIQMVFQDPYSSLNPCIKVSDAIIEPLIAHRLAKNKCEARDKAEALFRMVGLSESMLDRYPSKFSGGQRQRIGIARALAVNPELLVCDEAVSALDVSIQAQILNLFSDLKYRLGLSMLFIGHDLSAVRHISDRILVLYKGSVMEVLPAENLCSDAVHPYTQELLTSIPKINGEICSIQQAENTVISSEHGCKFCIRCPKADGVCFEAVPDLERIADDHFVRCHKA